MSKANKVEVQKGSINANPQTMKQMTHREKLTEAFEQAALRRRGQTLDLHEPKSSRK